MKRLGLVVMGVWMMGMLLLPSNAHAKEVYVYASGSKGFHIIQTQFFSDTLNSHAMHFGNVTVTFYPKRGRASIDYLFYNRLSKVYDVRARIWMKVASRKGSVVKLVLARPWKGGHVRATFRYKTRSGWSSVSWQGYLFEGICQGQTWMDIDRKNRTAKLVFPHIVCPIDHSNILHPVFDRKKGKVVGTKLVHMRSAGVKPPNTSPTILKRR
ncbi:MAG: hypothetical protein EP343_28610 [Deltaproteobacteria bacterium]|nr:MAG: hypothetical protein EP343_28610 [Deltaproteobacteria bacterium]